LGGGGGGGAILIASSTRIDIPSGGGIFSKGQNFHYSDGSGGAIRLVAPVVAGAGTLDVAEPSSYAGSGRIRIDSIDRSALNITYTAPPSGSVGSFMVVFPSPLPRLDILRAAGVIIPEGTNSPVSIYLPYGANPTNQIVVQARNFGTQVPISLVLTPESGNPLTYLSTIDNSANNPAVITNTVVFPVNTRVIINAWTR